MKGTQTTVFPSIKNPVSSCLGLPRPAISELALSAVQRSGYLLEHHRLEHASRSCSTWVAVGDVSTASQLPSPHGSSVVNAPQPPSFTPADLIKSVNKKVFSYYLPADANAIRP